MSCFFTKMATDCHFAHSIYLHNISAFVDEEHLLFGCMAVIVCCPALDAMEEFAFISHLS